jgi:hypothetical protein
MTCTTQISLSTAHVALTTTTMAPNYELQVLQYEYYYTIYAPNYKKVSGKRPYMTILIIFGIAEVAISNLPISNKSDYFLFCKKKTMSLELIHIFY